MPMRDIMYLPLPSEAERRRHRSTRRHSQTVPPALRPCGAMRNTCGAAQGGRRTDALQGVVGSQRAPAGHENLHAHARHRALRFGTDACTTFQGSLLPLQTLSDMDKVPAVPL